MSDKDALAADFTSLYCALDDFLGKVWAELEAKDAATAKVLREAVESQVGWMIAMDAQLGETELTVLALARISRVARAAKRGILAAEGQQ